MVVESSHGVLTDRFLGFHPHTSALRTLPRFTREMIEKEGYGGELVSIGVTRAYQIRHGAGPMPTANEAMAEDLLPGSHKEENRYQGKVRVGPLDLVLLRYALEASGGSKTFDGLAVTWFDQIEEKGTWNLCEGYQGSHDPVFFTPQGELKVRCGTDEKQLEHQESLGRELKSCLPILKSEKLPSGASREELYNLCSSTIEESTGVSVRMVSFGPTDRDKICK